MNRRDFLKQAFIAGSCFWAGCNGFNVADDKKQSKPNVIIIFTDDHGFADLGCQQQFEDIKTPNIDTMAKDGVRCTSGYITAPQCSPSRAGLMTGKYQQRFGCDQNGTLPPSLDEKLISERMKDCGYKTGIVGKWHLELGNTDILWLKQNMPEVIEKFESDGQKKADGSSQDNAWLGIEKQLDGRTVKISHDKSLPYYPSERGFDETYFGYFQRYWATYKLNGEKLPDAKWCMNEGFRLDIQTKAAETFIDMHHSEPFFLYLAYFAPHVPLEATEKYLSRFPEDMPIRRRHALAMLSAIDDGVGSIRGKLDEYGITDNTIIFFISDNGAPLKIDKKDIPLSFKGGAWDGSRNDPWVGEKGMLTEGGIRVPFIVSYPDRLPKGVTYNKPVISLDATATAISLASGQVPNEFDGVDIIPYLNGTRKDEPHQALYWRFWNQSAIRKGKWKYLKAGKEFEFLFDLESGQHEKENLIAEYPQIAEKLKVNLQDWAGELQIKGIPDGDLKDEELGFYEHYMSKKK